MARGYTKGDVEFHEERYMGPGLPAVNVKAYHYPDIYDVMDEFGCDEKAAQQALDFAFESTQEVFWNEFAPGLADAILVPHFGKLQVYSAGRSSGWLICHGMDYRDYVEESWDAIDLAKWHKFEKAVKAEVKFMCSWDYVKELIEMNNWTEV